MIPNGYYMTDKEAKDFLEKLMVMLQTGVSSEGIFRNNYWRSARTSILALDKRIPKEPYFQNGR